MDRNIPSIAQMGLRRNWISSPVEEVMNKFVEGDSKPSKSYFFHFINVNGYGSTTQNPSLH